MSLDSFEEYERYSIIYGTYFYGAKELKKKYGASDNSFRRYCNFYKRWGNFSGRGKTDREKERDRADFYGLDSIIDVEAKIDKKWNDREPEKNLIKRIRSRVRQFVDGGYDEFEKYVGCDRDTFRKYIEAKFSPGMTWDNWGKWHLDHIIPVNVYDFTDEEDIYKCCNYRNFQPLWARDNLTKSHEVSRYLVKKNNIYDLLPKSS